jgi:D-amino-acid oxidase
MSNKHNVLIIGAGVSGLTTALKLLNAGHAVTLWSKEGPDAHPHTSASAYAMWVPITFDARLQKWADEGLTEFSALAADSATGVVLRQITQLKPDGHAPNVIENAPVIDPPVYLDWLRAQVVTAGGVIEKRSVSSLSEAPAAYDVIVNCSGLAARELAADPAVYADRVQVITIKANGFNRVVIDDEGPNKRACVVPHASYIKLGAVFDGRNETLETDDAHTQDILDRCNRMVPELQARREDILSVVRALRPEREGWLPRVEKTTLPDGRTLVHNYGHDGMGFILSHGIADEIARYLA